jgi:hypothetical protein
MRVLPDGARIPDNPKREGWRPEIWSIGHRNVQGAGPQPGQRPAVDHRARRTRRRRINIPQSGKNYGWPIITYGRDYSGVKIGEGTEKPGLEQPVYYWDPSIAPSGAAFYTGDLFPEWKATVRRRPGGPGPAPAGPRRREDRRGGSPAEGPARAHPGRAPGARRRHLALTDDPQGRVLRVCQAPRLARFVQSITLRSADAPSWHKALRTGIRASFRGGRRGKRAPATRLGPFLLTLSRSLEQFAAHSDGP